MTEQELREFAAFVSRTATSDIERLHADIYLAGYDRKEAPAQVFENHREAYQAYLERCYEEARQWRAMMQERAERPKK